MASLRAVSVWLMGVNAMLGVGLFLPLIPLLEADAHMSGLQIGILSGAFPLTEGLGGGVYARLLQRVAPKTLMVAGQVFCVLGCVALVVSSDFWVILAGRILGGAGSASIAVAQFLIGRAYEGPERVSRLGRISGAQALGFVIGLLATAAAALLFPGLLAVKAAGAAALALGAASALMVTLLDWDRPAPGTRAAVAFRELPLVDLALYGCNTFVYISFAMLTSIWAGRTPGIGAPGTSLIFIGLGALSMYFQAWGAGSLARRVGSHGAVACGFLVLFVGAALFGLDLAPPLTLAGLVICMLGYSLVAPNALAAILGRADVKAAERRSGWALLAACIGASLGPVLTGAIEGASTIAAAVSVLAAAAAGGTAVATARYLQARRSGSVEGAST